MTVNAAPRAGRREWIGLAVLGLPTMLLSLDLSVLFLALPHLGAELDASATQQLWITDIYGFLTAGFLITMGTLGDRIGRRRLMLTGAAIFGVASLLAAYSTSAEMLIVTRALLGIAGATLLPSTLALVSSMFRDPKQMGVAIAAWTTSYMAGLAFGPVVGGVMLEYFWWGSVFLLGIPVMVLLLIVGPVVLPEHKDPDAAGKLDLASVGLSLAAMLPIIYGLKELAGYGLAPLPFISIAVGLAFGYWFVTRQRQLDNPLLDLGLFRIRTIRVAAALVVLISVIQNGNAFVVTLFVQLVHGLSPLEAGLWLLVPSLGMVAAINSAPHLSRRYRPGYVYAAGLVLSAAGYLLLTQAGASGSLVFLMVAVFAAFSGVGFGGALTNQLVMGAAPPARAGSAASLTATGGEFGIAFGVASLGSIAAVVYRNQVTVPDQVPAGDVRTAGESIAGAVSTAERLPATVGADLLESAREAFTTALNTLATVNALLFAAAAVLVAAVLRQIPPAGQEPPAPAEPAGSEPAGSDPAGSDPAGSDAVPARAPDPE